MRAGWCGAGTWRDVARRGVCCWRVIGQWPPGALEAEAEVEIFDVVSTFALLHSQTARSPAVSRASSPCIVFTAARLTNVSDCRARGGGRGGCGEGAGSRRAQGPTVLNGRRAWRSHSRDEDRCASAWPAVLLGCRFFAKDTHTRPPALLIQHSSAGNTPAHVPLRGGARSEHRLPCVARGVACTSAAAGVRAHTLLAAHSLFPPLPIHQLSI